jgi:hypothetical protein
MPPACVGGIIKKHKYKAVLKLPWKRKEEKRMEKENDNKVLETGEKIPDESMDEVDGGQLWKKYKWGGLYMDTESEEYKKDYIKKYG